MMLPGRKTSAAFEWNPPASEAAIRQAEHEYGGPLPADYVKLIKVANGGCTDGNLSILEVEDCVQRNADYEVGQYLPGYFMIGDDGAGTAILIQLRDRRIYECDMGVMDARFVTLSAGSLDELLELGTSLMERDASQETAG